MADPGTPLSEKTTGKWKSKRSSSGKQSRSRSRSRSRNRNNSCNDAISLGSFSLSAQSKKWKSKGSSRPFIRSRNRSEAGMSLGSSSEQSRKMIIRESVKTKKANSPRKLQEPKVNAKVDDSSKPATAPTAKAVNPKQENTELSSKKESSSFFQKFPSISAFTATPKRSVITVRADKEVDTIISELSDSTEGSNSANSAFSSLVSIQQQIKLFKTTTMSTYGNENSSAGLTSRIMEHDLSRQLDDIRHSINNTLVNSGQNIQNMIQKSQDSIRQSANSVYSCTAQPCTVPVGAAVPAFDTELATDIIENASTALASITPVHDPGRSYQYSPFTACMPSPVPTTNNSETELFDNTSLVQPQDDEEDEDSPIVFDTSTQMDNSKLQDSSDEDSTTLPSIELELEMIPTSSKKHIKKHMGGGLLRGFGKQRRQKSQLFEI